MEFVSNTLTAFRDIARESPWPTGIAFGVLVVYFAIKFTNLPKKLKSTLWWDKPKPTPCMNCISPGETYCVDCKKVYCRFCCCLLHHPGMKTEKHSIEGLVETEPGVQILSVLLGDFLTLGIIVGFMCMITRVSEEQILGASYCPVVQTTRQALVRWDPSIFYYFKNHFAQLCDFEDSAWRLYIDAWFRAVVTRTDSLFLVLAAFVKAFLFEKYIEIVLARIMGVLYGVLAVIARYIESYIPERYHFLEAFAKAISFSKFIKAAGKPPPPTFWRRRPMQNWAEGWKYCLDRRARLFSYYQGHAQAIQMAWLRGLLYGALFLRLACILFGADYYLRAVLTAIGFGPLMQREQKMFLGLTGVAEQESYSQYLSEWLFTMSFMSLMQNRWVAVGPALEVTGTIFEGIRAALWPVARVFFVPGLICFALQTLYTRMITKQNAYFIRNWPTVREEIFGSCNRDNLVKWKEVSFVGKRE